jgi:hypothetical protein
MKSIGFINRVSWTAVVLLFLFGCAVMSNPKEEEIEKISLPPKVSVDIPDALNPDTDLTKSLQKIKIDKQSGYAQGYINIVEYIDLVEYVITQIKLLIPLVDHSMLDIQKECQGTSINEVCKIEAGRVSIVLNEELLLRLRSLFQVDLQVSNRVAIGEEITYGDIEFAQYDNNHTYNYKLSIDITELHSIIYEHNISSYKAMQVIEWSDDNNTVLSSLYNGDGETFDKAWTISYENEGFKERMHLYDTEFDVDPLPQFSNTFTLTKLYDANNTYYAKYNSITNPYSYGTDSRTSEKFTSYTQLTNGNGYQRFVTSNPYLSGDPLYREDSVFDNFGKLLALTYCDEIDEQCSIENPDSWYSDAEDETIFEPIAKMPVDFMPLKISGGNLEKDGSYFLLPKELNLSEMTIDDVVVKSVGEFIYAYEATQGILYDDAYSDSLETLQIVYAKYNDEVSIALANRNEVAFELVQASNRPTLVLALPKE